MSTPAASPAASQPASQPASPAASPKTPRRSQMLPNWTPGAPKRQAASKRPSDDVSNGLDSKRGRFEGVVTPIRERNKRTPLCPNPAASTDAPRLVRQKGVSGEAALDEIKWDDLDSEDGSDSNDDLDSEGFEMSTPHRPNRKASINAPKKPARFLERQAGLFGEAAEKAIELIPIGLVSECSAMSTPHRPNRKASTDAPKKPKGRPLLHRSDGVDESLLVKKEK